jgi:hypothetical protein
MPSGHDNFIRRRAMSSGLICGGPRSQLERGLEESSMRGPRSLFAATAGHPEGGGVVALAANLIRRRAPMSLSIEKVDKRKPRLAT